MRFSERGHWELHALDGPRQLPESAPAAVTGFEGGEKRLSTDLGRRRGFFLMNQFAIGVHPVLALLLIIWNNSKSLGTKTTVDPRRLSSDPGSFGTHGLGLLYGR